MFAPPFTAARFFTVFAETVSQSGRRKCSPARVIALTVETLRIAHFKLGPKVQPRC